MNEQYPQTPRQNNQHPNHPKQGTPPGKSSDCAPCNGGDDPQYPPCPEPRPCPELPTRPCPPPEPDPCEEPPPPESSDDSCEPPPDPCEEPAEESDTPITTAAQQLEALRKAAERGQKKLQKFEPLKAKLEDVTKRIADLEKLIAGQAEANAKYVTFYREIEVFKSALECSIPTIRCQLTLTDKQKKCIAKAIACVNARVEKARKDRDAQKTEVERLERRQKKLQGDLDWAKKWFDFFGTDLQAQVAAQRDDLKELQGKLDPSKDQCEVWFFLAEMEGMLRSARGDDDSEACYLGDINIATFLDCWSPDCFKRASEYWLVAFNDAESAVKVGAIELAEAQKRLTELETAAQEANGKRRQWVLDELKVQDCCGPLSKCP